MGFDRTGRKHIAPGILGTQAQIDTAKRMKADRSEPKDGAKNKELKATDQELSAQTKLAKGAASDPAIAGLASQLHLDTLDHQDSIQAAYLQKLLIKHGGGAGTPATQVSNKELQAYFSMAGETLSPEEAQALRMLEPLMTPIQRQALLDVRDKDFELETAPTSTAERLKIGAMMFAPYTPALATGILGPAAGLSGDALSIAILAGFGGGVTAGEYLQKEAIAAKKGVHGVNILEDNKINNEFVRLHAQVTDETRLDGDLMDVIANVSDDAALFGAVLEMRNEALAKRDEPMSEKEAEIHQNFGAYHAALVATEGEAAKGPEQAQQAVAALKTTRAAFLKLVKPEELSQLASGIRPNRVISEDQFRVGVNRLIDSQIQQMVGTINAPLQHLVSQLEKECNVAAHQDTRDAPKLSASALAALKATVSEKPNLPELMGLAKLAYSGAISLSDVWPEVDHKILPGAGKMDAGAVIEDLGRLGLDDQGEFLEKFGKLLQGPISQVLGLGSIAAVLFMTDLNFWPWGFAAGFGPRLAGQYIGSKMVQKGRELRAVKNVDYVSGRPIATEYEVMLDRLKDPKALLSGGDEGALKQSFGEEAAIITRLSNSVRSLLPQMPEQDQEAFKTYQEPIYDALQQFAWKLDTLAKSDLPADQLKSQAAAAHAELMSPATQRAVQAELLRQTSTDDYVRDPRAQLTNAKIELLNTIRSLVDGKGEVPLGEFVQQWKQSGLRHDAFLGQAREVADLGRVFEMSQTSRWDKIMNMIPFVGGKKQRDLDAVDEFAAKIVDGRFQKTSLSDLMGLYEQADELQTSLLKDMQANWPVDGDRANEIAEEMLGVLWDRMHPLVGNFGDTRNADAPPKLEAETAVMKTEGENTYFEVTGKLDGRGKGADGTLTMRVDAFGMADLSSIKIDYGEAVLKDVAAATVARQLPGAKIRDVKLTNQDASGYTFEVTTKAGNRSVQVTPDGFVAA